MFEIKFKLIGLICMVMGIYAAGVITAQYKFFPYHEIRAVKNFIVGDITVSAKHTSVYKGNPYYHLKKSFFEEFKPDADVIMFGDSKTDIAEWKSIFPAEKIANYGISGDTSAGALNRMHQVDTQNNPKIFIMLGINDLLQGEEVEDIFNNYKKIVDHFVLGNANVYIQSTLFISERKSRNQEIKNINNKVSRLNNLLKHVAANNERVLYLDINSLLAENMYLDEKYTIKGRSLNGDGYKVWSNLIKPYVISSVD